MKARDVISPRSAKTAVLPGYTVDAGMALTEVLPGLLESPDHMVAVRDGEKILGIIDEHSLLEGFGRMMPARPDASVVVIEVSPAGYSAADIARAVEDAEVHLVDLWSAPGQNGDIRVTLRVRSEDPSSVVGSLERHGFHVVEASGRSYRDADIAYERIAALQALLDI